MFGSATLSTAPPAPPALRATPVEPRPAGLASGTAPVVPVRGFDVADRAAVTDLLVSLPDNYPGAGGWLHRRLDDVAAGQAHCLLADSAQPERPAILESPAHAGWRARRVAPAGVVILTPKQHAMKLSTIFVAPTARRAGLGTILLTAAVRVAHEASAPELYLTVAHTSRRELEPLLTRFGFTPTALELDRYGQGRHEWVFTRVAHQ